MMRVNGFIRQQALQILDNNRLAMLYATLLALFPYTTWLSLVVLALVTLKKGWRDGAQLMLPVLTIYCVCLRVSSPTLAAIVNSLLTFVPCYLGACVLGKTSSWRAVSGAFFLLIACSAILLQMCMPEFIAAQYQYVYAAINAVHPEMLSRVVNESRGLNPQSLSNYLLGIQLLSLIFAATLPLALARSVQARLYYPGGFHQEMLMFRGNAIGVFILALLLFGVSQHRMIAMNMIPAVVFYFLLTGISLGLYALSKWKIGRTVLLFSVPLVLVPFVMIPVYVIIGSLDSLFNLRLYLPSNAGKTT